MSNDVSEIYVLVSWVFLNVQFRHFDSLKMRFLIIHQRVLLSQWFVYTCVGIRNICKDHHFLNVNSVCWSSNIRIPHLMSIKRMSIGDLIYVLVSLVFNNVHFRHFGGLKMRFLIIRQQVLLSPWFWIYLSWY